MGKKLPQEKYTAKPRSEDINLLEIDGYVGAMVAEFNNLEQHLQFLLESAIGCDTLAATAVWTSIMYKTRLEILDLTIRSRPQFQEILPYWTRLHEFLKELGGDRNFITHGKRLQTFKDGAPIKEAIVSANAPDFYGMARRDDEIDIDEMNEIILDMRVATQALASLQHCLLGRDPSPKKLVQEAIRRRPPRPLRRSKKNAKRQAPP